MLSKPLILAVALVSFPAAALAQSTASPTAPMQDQSPTTSPSPGAAGAPQTSTGTQAGAAIPATLADLTPSAAVYDSSGAKVGTIESATSAGAVVFTGTARAQIPVASFAKNAQGLVIGITKAQLEAAVAKAAAAKAG